MRLYDQTFEASIFEPMKSYLDKIIRLNNITS